MIPTPRRHRLMLLVTCLIGALAVQADVTATLSHSPQRLYQHQVFTLTLTINADGQRLHPEFEVFGLADNPTLEFLSTPREMKATSAYERRFVWDARLTDVTTVTLKPTLKMIILTRDPSGFRRRTRLTVQAPVHTLRALPLPITDRPADFSGAVGNNFSFDVSVSPTDVSVGDLIKATLHIKGSHRLDTVSPPRFSPGRGFKVYDPTLLPESSANELRVEQVVIPQTETTNAIPPITFNYFDPLAATYRAITRGPFPLRFHPATNTVVEAVPIASLATNRVSTNAVTTTTTEPETTENALASWLRGLRTTLRALPRATANQDLAAYLAPADSSLNTFDIPAGTTVDVLELHASWVRIAHGEKRGWIPLNQIELMTP